MILFSIISIIFYYILCKNLVFISYDDVKLPFKRIHLILLSIGACIPYLNIFLLAAVIMGIFISWLIGDIGIKNHNSKFFEFFNKEI